jgi:hypothetical protein
MDAEETNRLFTQATLRALTLEIDRDVEVLRAQKYRAIISALAGDNSGVAPPVGALAPAGNLPVCLLVVIVKICDPLIRLT